MKRIIIVGATSGIGKALAELFTAEKNLVGITGRRSQLLDELKQTNAQQFEIAVFDVNDLRNAQELETLVAKIGGLDVLIYSSGVGEFNKQLDFALEKQMIDTNVVAFTQVADWTFNYFQKQGHGSFASVTSIAGLMGSRHAPAYNASKAYQINYLKCLRLKSKNLKLPIIITDLRTGFVNTAMAKGNSKFWVASPEKAARQIKAAIHRKVGVAYITKRWELVGFLLRFFG